MFVCIDAPKGLDGALMRLFRPCDRCESSPVEGPVAFVRGGRGRLNNWIRVGRLVERCLLLVKDVAAQVLGLLVVVQLCLVCVAAVLSETQLGLAPFGRGDRYEVIVIGGRAAGIKRNLCFVKALLVAVSADLFAFGDALIDVHKRLFSVEFRLLAGT